MATERFANAAQAAVTAAAEGYADSAVGGEASTRAPGAGEQFRVIVGTELMVVTGVSGTTWTVTRGAEGTVAAAHVDGSTVTAIVTNAALASLAPSAYVDAQDVATATAAAADATTKANAAQAAATAAAEGYADSAVGGEASTRAAADATRLNWRGAWAATTVYAANDAVSYNGGFYRALTGFTSAGSFNAANWHEIVPQSGTYVPSAPSKPSQLQVPSMYAAYKPQYYEAAYRGTNYRSSLGGGNGAVISLRFDDCPSTDYTSVFPLLKARQLPAGFAVVSGFLGLGGRITASQMVEMANAGCEILCHTAHHDTNPTLTDAYWSQETDQAVASIQAQAQAVANPAGFNQDICVENFIQPGTWTTEPANCANPQDLESIYWLWIQNHFAAAEGYIRDPMLRKVSSSDLDGVKMLPSLYRYGTTHATLCPLAAPTGFASTLAYGKALVDQCVRYGGYLSLVLHSANLDQTGNMTTADLTTLLDYINAYRAADQCEVMNPTAAIYATRADEPYNLLADPSWNDSAVTLNPSWVASGAPVVKVGAGYSGGNAIDVDSANSVTQPKFQIGQLTEPACRTLQLTCRYKNADAGSAQVPRFILRFYDGGTNNWVSSDTSTFAAGAKPTAQDGWTRFDVIARAPRFPAGAGNAPIYCIVFVMGTTAGNKVRVSDLLLRKV